jgi:thiamine kinase-like enzyme
LRYGVTVRGEAESWLGKIYVHDDDLASGRIQRALWEASRTGAAPCVPEVVGILPDVRLVVQRHVDGTSVYDSLRAGSLTAAHLAATARAARALHHAPVGMPRQHTWHDELDVVRGAVDRSSLAGDARNAAHTVCATLACASVDRQPRFVPVHRDFYDKQVLVTPGGITVIDFDTASASYPELDVANFVAHLWLRSLQGYVQVDRAAEYALSFVASYLDGGTLDGARYRLTLATTWLRLAAVYAMRPLWHQLSPALVEVAARAAHGPADASPLGLTRVLFAAGARR